MPRYANFDGDSGVIAYETDVDSITVQFRDGSVYLYNSLKPGSAAVQHMKSLAAAGRGLNSYISGVIYKNYARKLR